MISDYVYRRLVAAIFDSPRDTRVGCGPEELLEHIKEVFQVDEETHQDIRDHEEQSRPVHSLVVHVVRGHNIPLVGSKDDPGPYCIISLDNPGAYGTSAVGPNFSKKIAFNLISGNINEKVQCTQCLLRNSDDPEWDELLTFDIDDGLDQLLNFYIIASGEHGELVNSKTKLQDTKASSNNHLGSASSRSREERRSHKNSGLLRVLMNAVNKQQLKESATASDVLWSSSIALSELRLNRWEQKRLTYRKHSGVVADSMSLSEDSSLLVRVHLSFKARSWYSDAPEAELLSMHDLVDVMKQLNVFNAKLQQENYSESLYSGDVMDSSEAVIEQLVYSNNISYLSVKILNMAILLNWSSSVPAIELADQTLVYALEKLEGSIRSALSHFPDDQLPCTQFDVDYLHDAVCTYMDEIVENTEKPTFFPPGPNGGLLHFNRKVDFLMALMRLPLWKVSLKKPIDKLSAMLGTIIQEDAADWLSGRISCLSFLNVGDEMASCSTLADTLEQLSQSFNAFLPNYVKFFNKFDVDYPLLTFQLISRKLAPLITHSMHQVMVYVRLSWKQDDLLIYSSKVTIRLHQAILRFIDCAHKFIDDTQICQLEVCDFEKWFMTSLPFWLFTWEAKSCELVMRAVENDLELNCAADKINYVESTVNALAICNGICTEFDHLELKDLHTRGVAVIKLAETVCQGVLIYSRYLISHSKPKFKKGSCTLRIRVANSIEQCGTYMQDNLRKFVKMESLVSDLKEHSSPENQALSQCVQDKLNRLLENTRNTTHSLAVDMIETAIEDSFMTEVENHMEELTQTDKEWTDAIKKKVVQVFTNRDVLHSLLLYLEKVIVCVEGQIIQQDLFDAFVKKLWLQTLHKLSQHTKSGQKPEYYVEIMGRVKDLDSFFEVNCDCDTKRRPCCTHSGCKIHKFIYWLHLNASTTEKLLLDCFAYAADKTPIVNDDHPLVESTCTISLKAGYAIKTHGEVCLIIQVINGTNFPPLDHLSQSCDPYVRIELQPFTEFSPWGDFPVKQTKTCYNTLNPEFNQTFHYDLTEEQLFMRGSVIYLMGIDEDFGRPHDVAGYAAIHLAQLPKLTWIKSVEESIRDAPTIRVVLRQHRVINEGAFQVIIDRSEWDSSAEYISDTIRWLTRYRSLPPWVSQIDLHKFLCGGFNAKFHKWWFSKSNSLRERLAIVKETHSSQIKQYLQSKTTANHSSADYGNWKRDHTFK